MRNDWRHCSVIHAFGETKLRRRMCGSFRHQPTIGHTKGHECASDCQSSQPGHGRICSSCSYPVSSNYQLVVPATLALVSLLHCWSVVVSLPPARPRPRCPVQSSTVVFKSAAREGAIWIWGCSYTLIIDPWCSHHCDPMITDSTWYSMYNMTYQKQTDPNKESRL